MTPASVAIILSKVETLDVNDPALIGWEPVTDDLEDNEENRHAIAGCVLDCNGLWNRHPIPHRIVRNGQLISLWVVPAAADHHQGSASLPAAKPKPEPTPPQPSPPTPTPTPEPKMNRFGKTAADVIGELHPLFKGLLFAAAARSDDESRAALTHISIEREGLEYRIVGTDGKRMHIHEFDPGLFDSDIEHLDPGLYEVIAKSAKFIVVALNEEAPKFPEWRRLLPSKEPKMHSATICARTTSKMGIVTKELLATDFAAEAIGFGCGRKKDDTALVEYGSTGEGKAFLIKHDLGTAIVMPMNFDHAEGEEPRSDAEATPPLAGFELPPQPTGRVAKFVKSMQDTLGPEGSMELVNPATGKGVKIAAGKVTPIHGKETQTDEQ